MSYSYKCYSDTKDFMKKFVNAEEGAIIYGISKSRIIVIAREAGAVYKVGNSALINTELFEKYLERFREPARELPKHTWNKLKEMATNLKEDKVVMGFSIALIIIVLIVLYSLARTAGESDRTMEQIREQSLLGREESSGGNS